MSPNPMNNLNSKTYLIKSSPQEDYDTENKISFNQGDLK